MIVGALATATQLVAYPAEVFGGAYASSQVFQTSGTVS
jgi:hypothetical protein